MEFKEYENAIGKYFSKLTVNKLPLSSWSFYFEEFNRVKNVLGDSSTIEQILTLNDGKYDWNFKEELQNDTVIVITDPVLNILFASKNIIKMNGYHSDEVVGNSPKMFQGKLTDNSISKEISTAVKTQKPFDKIIINYCKNGSTYRCHIKGYPVFNKSGVLINFIAFEKIAA